MNGLDYNADSESGVIMNATYHWGAVYRGVAFRPNLSFPYHSFVCHPMVNKFEVVESDGTVRPLTEAEIAEITAIAAAWVQPLGQEGNPTTGQRRVMELRQAKQDFEVEIRELSSNATAAEMISWATQESEALAIIANPGANTPFLTTLAQGRGQGESPRALADKVVAAATLYRANFAVMLGAYHHRVKEIEDTFPI